MIVIVIAIAIVLSCGYDRGVDIRVSYARMGQAALAFWCQSSSCLVDVVTRENRKRDGTSARIWTQ